VRQTAAFEHENLTYRRGWIHRKKHPTASPSSRDEVIVHDDLNHYYYVILKEAHLSELIPHPGN